MLKHYIIVCYILFDSIPSEVPQKLPQWTLFEAEYPKRYQNRFFNPLKGRTNTNLISSNIGVLN